MVQARRLLVTVLLAVVALALAGPPAASAAGGAYSLKWSAADPATNRAPYLPTYAKAGPDQIACPTPSGSSGRAADPLANAVAYASPATSSNFDAVSSLTPKDMALGQVVPFEMEVTVGSAPDGALTFNPYWLARTSSGTNFGFDASDGLLCAFVDTADAGTSDPGGDARVTAYSSTTGSPGTSNEQIKGAITVGGLQAGDKVVVELWVVLKDTIAPGTTGNVQTGIDGATEGTSAVNVGNQTLPLLRVQDFFNASADLSVVKSDGPDPATQGGTLTYTLVAKNLSSDTVANSVVLTDRLDANTTFVSATGAPCTASGGVVTCTVGALSPGQQVSVVLTTTVGLTAPTTRDPTTTPEAGFAGTACLAEGWDLCNRVAVASGITGDPTPANNGYVQPTNVVLAAAPRSELQLKKVVRQTSFSFAGAQLDYTLTATNTGDTTLLDVSITDPLLGTLSCAPGQGATLTPGATLTCTGSYTTTDADFAAGRVDNTATAEGTTPDEEPVTATASASVPPKQAAVTLTKTAGQTEFTEAGEALTYTLVARNTGEVPLSGVTVSDIKLGALDCTPAQPAVLAVGAELTCTGSYRTTAQDVADGVVENTAHVLAATPDGGFVADDDQADVPKADDPPPTPGTRSDLHLTKTPSAERVEAGGLLTWKLTVRNDGPDAAGGVTIVDPLPHAVTFVSAGPGCSFASGAVTCAVGTIGAGASASRDVTVRVDADFDWGAAPTTHELVVQKVEEPRSLAAGQTVDTALSCPSGFVMLDGSARVDSIDQGAGRVDDVRVIGSRSDPADAGRYLFRIANDTTGQAQLHLFGVCVDRSTTVSDGHAHRLGVSDVVSTFGDGTPGRQQRTVTCPAGTAAVAPGHRFAGAEAELFSSEASADGRSWTFGYDLHDHEAIVTLTVRCLDTRTSTDHGHFEVLQLTHVHDLATVAPSDFSTSQPHRDVRVTCPDGAKGVTGTFDLPAGVKQLGSTPQPINRDFRLVNTTDAPLEAHLDLLCLGLRVGDFGSGGAVVNRAWAFSDQLDTENDDDLATSAAVQVVPATPVAPPVAPVAPAAPDGGPAAGKDAAPADRTPTVPAAPDGGLAGAWRGRGASVRLTARGDGFTGRLKASGAGPGGKLTLARRANGSYKGTLVQRGRKGTTRRTVTARVDAAGRLVLRIKGKGGATRTLERAG